MRRVVGLISLYLRRNIHTKPLSNEPDSLGEQKEWRKFFLIFFLGGQTGSLGFLVFFNLKNFLYTYGVSIVPHHVALTMLIASCTSLIYGFLAFRFFDPKHLAKVGLLASGLVFPATLMLASQHAIPIMLSLALLGLCIGAHGALQHAIFQNLTRVTTRQRFVSLAFTTGTGTLVSLSLFITQNHSLISLTWISCVSGLTFLLLKCQEKQSLHVFH